MQIPDLIAKAQHDVIAKSCRCLLHCRIAKLTESLFNH